MRNPVLSKQTIKAGQSDQCLLAGGCLERIADFIGLPYFSRFLSGLRSHALISHDYFS